MPTRQAAAPRRSGSRPESSSSSSGNNSISPGKLRKSVRRLLGRSSQHKKESRATRADMPASLPLNDEAPSQPDTQRRRSRSSGATRRQRTDRPTRNRSTSVDKSRKPGETSTEKRTPRRRLKTTSTSVAKGTIGYDDGANQIDGNMSVAGSVTTATTASTSGTNSTFSSNDSSSSRMGRTSRLSDLTRMAQRRSTTQRRGRRQPPQRFPSDSLTMMQQPPRVNHQPMMRQSMMSHHPAPRQQFSQMHPVGYQMRPRMSLPPQYPQQYYGNGPAVIHDPRFAQDYGQVFHADLDDGYGQHDHYEYANDQGINGLHYDYGDAQHCYEEDEERRSFDVTSRGSRKSVSNAKTAHKAGGVRFSVVEIFEHPTTVGIEPVSEGPALTMQWEASSHCIMEIDRHTQQHVAKRDPPSGNADTIDGACNNIYRPLTATERHERLSKNGVPLTQVQSSMLESQYTFQQRLETRLKECILDLKTQRQQQLQP